MNAYTTAINFEEKKTVPIERVSYAFAMTICGLSALYLLSVILTGRAWLPFPGIDAYSSELNLSLIQCLLGAVALHLPMLVTKFTHIKIPDALCIIFYVFVLCGTVFGEMFSLYYEIPFWDDLLHCGSGMMAGMLGSILVINFLRKTKCQNAISPIFIAIATICFALFIGVVWEIYEFAVDSLLGQNMQKYLLQDGSELIGQAALADTMLDLIVDMFGALIAATVSYLSLKRKKGWIHAYQTDIIPSHHIEKRDIEKNPLPRSA